MTKSTPNEEIAGLRQSSRETVRELGMLGDGRGQLGVSHTQCHTLIELERHGHLTAGELADRLCLDKSTMSRAIRKLRCGALVETCTDPADARRKTLSLTAEGLEQVRSIDAMADQQVGAALHLMSPRERETVRSGMALYARALAKARVQQEHLIRPIEARDDATMAQIMRTVLQEFNACGPGFAIQDAEVRALSAAYSPPHAGFFVLEREEVVVGGAGYGPLAGGEPGFCELRKMYLLPEARGTGMGKRLLLHILDQARTAGYRACYLETLTNMSRARALYRAVGFRDLENPLGDTGHFGCNKWMIMEL